MTTDEMQSPAILLEIIKTAVRHARPHRTTESPRWVAVRDTFCVGSETATNLCKMSGVDPHETARGVRCDLCVEREDGR